MKQEYLFIPNLKDDRHCEHAVMAMILASSRKKIPSFSQMDRKLHHKKNDLTWSIETMWLMKKFGYKGVLIDPFDYGRFSNEGKKFLRCIWTTKVVRWELGRTNIRWLQKIAKNIRWQERPATIADIQRFFRHKYYVVPTVNALALKGRRGYSQHVVLVTKITKTHITIHDPGLPPKKSWRIRWTNFEKAFTGTLKAFTY